MKQNEIKRVALSVKEASIALGINENYMYELVRQEGFPSFKIGSKYYISVQGLDMWVLKQAGYAGGENNG